jgi:predicted RecA/RadA family phage recombinase
MSPSTLIVTRTLGPTVGDAIHIGATQGTQGVAYGVQVSGVEASAPRDRVYRADVKASQNPEGWRRLVPSDQTESGTTWAVDVLVEGRTATFRLVRTGPSAASTVLTCKVRAYSAAGGSVDITGSDTTTTGATDNGTYERALLIKVDGKVGIGTETPATTLDVKGDASVSGNVQFTNLAYNVTGNNTLYLDEATGLVTKGPGFLETTITTTTTTTTSNAAAPWISRTSAADNEWWGVTYGNGVFVAVASSGSGNRVMTSSDGVTWTSRVSAADNDWWAVTYDNGIFVAVAISGTGNRVMTSPDGITWTLRTSAADNNWRSVTYGDGIFVAVAFSGSGNRVMTSPDGITWTIRESAADNQWLSVTYGNGFFVAVANTGTGDRVMTSSDGITWTSRQSAADNEWFGVTYGNGLFVAVASSGSGNRVMTSPDGITWTIRQSAADNNWRGVTYGNGVFVAVAGSGTGNRVMTWEAPMPVLFYNVDGGTLAYTFV